MFPVRYEDLPRLIKKAEKAGKDATELKRLYKSGKVGTRRLTTGSKLQYRSGKKTVTIMSTGPARREDFEHGKKVMSD